MPFLMDLEIRAMERGCPEGCLEADRAAAQLVLAALAARVAAAWKELGSARQAALGDRLRAIANLNNLAFLFQQAALAPPRRDFPANLPAVAVEQGVVEPAALAPEDEDNLRVE